MSSGEIRIFIRRQVAANPSGVALLLFGADCGRFWPGAHEVEQLADHEWRVTARDADSRPVVSVFHLDSTDRQDRRSRRRAFRIDVEDGTEVAGTATVARRTPVETTPTAFTTVSVSALAHGPRAGLLAGPIAGFVRNVACAAEDRALTP